MTDETKDTTPATETPGQGVEGIDELEGLSRKADEEIRAREAAAGAEADVKGAGETGDDEASVEKLRAYMVKHGIQDIGKLVDLASGLESTNTRLSQDVQRLSAVNFPIEGARFDRPAAGAAEEDDINLPENPIELVTDKAKLAKFVRDLDARADARAEKRQRDASMNNAQREVARKRAENPDEFDTLQDSMFQISKRYPRATIDQLFEAAKAQKTNERKALVAEIKKELGVGGDLDKLKGLAARLRTNPITAGSGVQVAISEKGKREDSDMLKAIAGADTY